GKPTGTITESRPPPRPTPPHLSRGVPSVQERTAGVDWQEIARRTVQLQVGRRLDRSDRSPHMPFHLKVLAGPAKGQTFPVPPVGSMPVGRGDVDTALTDSTASRQHFRMMAADGQVRILDLGSKAGTLVNGTRLSAEQPLRHGDVIVAGETHMQFISAGTI